MKEQRCLKMSKDVKKKVIGNLTKKGLRTLESLKKKYTGVQRERMVFGKWIDDEKVKGS